MAYIRCGKLKVVEGLLLAFTALANALGALASRAFVTSRTVPTGKPA